MSHIHSLKKEIASTISFYELQQITDQIAKPQAGLSYRSVKAEGYKGSASIDLIAKQFKKLENTAKQPTEEDYIIAHELKEKISALYLASDNIKQNMPIVKRVINAVLNIFSSQNTRKMWEKASNEKLFEGYSPFIHGNCTYTNRIRPGMIPQTTLPRADLFNGNHTRINLDSEKGQRFYWFVQQTYANEIRPAYLNAHISYTYATPKEQAELESAYKDICDLEKTYSTVLETLKMAAIARENVMLPCSAADIYTLKNNFANAFEQFQFQYNMTTNFEEEEMDWDSFFNSAENDSIKELPKEEMQAEIPNPLFTFQSELS